jgi:type IV pilus assembly protein PilO
VRINLRDPLTRNMIVVGVLVAGGLYVFFGTSWVPFGYQPTAQRLDEIRVDFEKKSSDLARARQAVADLPRFQAEFAALHERYELAKELLPQDREFPGLLRKITLTGQQAGVDFHMVQPEPPIEQGNYIELPIMITVRGGYHQFGQFLAQLANLRRIINVSDVRIKAQTLPDDLATCEASIRATAYMLNPAAGRPAETEGEES